MNSPKKSKNYINELIYRWERVKNLLETLGIEAILITSAPNIFYLCGFKSSQAYLLVTKGDSFLITDARYFERAKNLNLPFLEIKLILKDTFKELKSLFKSLHLKKIGFEKDRATYEFIEKIRSKDYKLYGLSQPLKNIRLLKSLSERENMKKSIEITDKIYKEILSFISKGLTELELRGKIVELAFKLGAEGESFPAIVATSAHSAIPHWETSREKIKNNAPLLIDMGVIFNGYCSDFTRTIFIGKADKEFKYHYELVKTAWFKAFEKIKEGVPIYELDKTVRDYFESKGVLSYFTHALGHGIGVEIHEHPRIFYKNQKKWLKESPLIEEGMVFTIEPGLYFPGKYGIRLENIVFVENGEGKVYSEIPLELTEL